MATPSSRRTQAERRAEATTRVLDAATRLVAEGGSRAASLAEVGRVAGYSRGIVNHHFGSKQQLLAAVVRRAQQVEVPEVAGGALDRLEAVVVAYVTDLGRRDPSTRAFLVLWTEALTSDRELVPLFAERDAWFRGLLADHVRRGVEDGTVRRDAAPEETAVWLLAALRGTGVQLLSGDALPPVEALAATLAGAVRRTLAADPRAPQPG